MNDHDQPTSLSIAGPDRAQAKHPALESKGIARRRLFQGGAAGAGILLSSPARSALNLTGCESPSAAFSGNLSRPVGGGDTCSSTSGGLSPGYWGAPQHFNNWPVALPTFNGEVADCGMNPGELNKLTLADLSGGETVDNVFGFRPKLADGSLPPAPVPLWAAIGLHTLFLDNNNGNYLFHLTAMYLNALTFRVGAAVYPMLPGQVIEFAKVIFGLQPTFCPAGAVCGGTKPAWTRAEVIQYVDYWSKRYDLNAELPNLCKKNNGN